MGISDENEGEMIANEKKKILEIKATTYFTSNHDCDYSVNMLELKFITELTASPYKLNYSCVTYNQK